MRRGRKVMTVIQVTRLDGSELVISAELVELLEAVPDTVITLTTGRKLVVREDVAEVVRRIKEYRRSVYGAALPGGGVEDCGDVVVLSTILGLFIGATLLVFGMMRGGSLTLFWDVSSLAIVLGGTIAATMISHPMEQLRQIGGLLRVAFGGRPRSPEEVIPLLVYFAEKARREGLLAMEEEASQLGDPFLRKGIQLVVDGVDPELVREVLQIEINFL